MKKILFIFLLIPSLCFANEYKILKPGIIFIERDILQERISLLNNPSNFCKIKGLSYFEEIDLKTNNSQFSSKGKKSAHIGDTIREKFNPLLEQYCNFLIYEINGNINESNKIKKEIINILLELADSKYLLNFPKDSRDTDHAYTTSFSVVPILFVYSQLKEYIKMNEIETIERMFKDLVKKNEYAFSSNHVGESTYGNHGFYANNLRLLTSIVINDSKTFNKSINFFLKNMKLNKTQSGLFKIESRRGECSLHYNLHILSAIMSTLWNLNIQSVNLINDKLTGAHNLNEIVEVIIDSVADPTIVIKENKRVGYNQSGRKTCSSSPEDIIKFGNNVIWLTNLSSMWFGPYYSMSNNKENKKKFIDSSLLQNYLYQGDDDSNLISYFQKFIYLDTDTKEEIKLHKKVSFDDLEF